MASEPPDNPLASGWSTMDHIFSSDDVHPRDRFSFWHEVACKELVQHHSKPDDPKRFYARLAMATLDDIAMLRVDIPAMVAERDYKHVARADHDDYLLCMQISGVLSFQGVNDLTLEAGEATILDPSQIYVARNSDNTRTMVARLPRRGLEARMGSATRFNLRELDSSNADLRLATRLLQSCMEETNGSADQPPLSGPGPMLIHGSPVG